MRRYKKKEMLKTVSILMEANDSIAGGQLKNTEDLVRILAQCQEMAALLGGFLETIGDEGMAFVRILEDYCENIYRISVNAANGAALIKLTGKTGKQLTGLSNMIRNELPDDKREIVFLPYKASMWDSFESVWKEACGDKGCEVYVVPIPYFEKNPDGTLARAHDEGKEYPPYVPVTSWREYSIPERRPDVIFIHNPYDGCNLVTEVPPDYYASNLRKFTDMLVYIPYFVALDDKVEKHFCITPGVLYAHKVIVQSEKVRQTYISELQKYEKENGCIGRFGSHREKIVVRESPKLVKARTLRRADFKVPEEWRALMTRRDGGVRKVIFYNTTVTAMLLHGIDMITKIERVMRIFRAQDEVVLLWRPHPLLSVTLRSMQPELLPIFERLKERYRAEGWGILDESADLYRAIAWSDAYYGDPSSVVELFKQTDKPILIQKVEI